MKRRSFIKNLGGAAVPMALGLGAGMFPWKLAAEELENLGLSKLTILHTNDVHSRLEPFPMDGGRNQGLGGVARRASLIRQIRQEEEQVLLFDCGDIFQGTPYFNFFNGELEIKLMSQMGYDAATIGNHDFDAGIEGLYRQLPHADFPFVIANYDFSDTIMDRQTVPYHLFQKGDLRIGVLGVGIELRGLVPDQLYKNTRYLDPIPVANRYAALLKNDYKCDYVICLSHLGFHYDDDQVSDHVLAARSKDIDLILGGHTHTFLEEPVQVKNAEGKPILVNQVGWAGILLGRIDVYFERRRRKHLSTGGTILVG